jgi:DNA-binding response OmpR family regulator
MLNTSVLNTKVTGLKTSKILLVDDQLSSLIAIEQLLEELDAKIFKATSAKEALFIMLKESIDCILLDVSMPDMDGFEFLKTLRSAPAHAGIPVIMVTGKIFSENESLRAYQYGAVDYLLKPLDSETVYRKVSFIVQQATRIRAVDGMAKIMKNFNRDVCQPLKKMHSQLQDVTDSHNTAPEKTDSESSETKKSAFKTEGANNQVSDSEIDHALLKLAQLHNLWENFDDTK